MNMQQIGKRIKIVRKLKGLSQTQLAVMSKIHLNTVYLLESGSLSDVRLETVLNICKALGLDPSSVLRGK